MSNTDKIVEQLIQYNRESAKTYETPPMMAQIKELTAVGGSLVIGTYLRTETNTPLAPWTGTLILQLIPVSNLP